MQSTLTMIMLIVKLKLDLMTNVKMVMKILQLHQLFGQLENQEVKEILQWEVAVMKKF